MMCIVNIRGAHGTGGARATRVEVHWQPELTRHEATPIPIGYSFEKRVTILSKFTNLQGDATAASAPVSTSPIFPPSKSYTRSSLVEHLPSHSVDPNLPATSSNLRIDAFLLFFLLSLSR